MLVLQNLNLHGANLHSMADFIFILGHTIQEPTVSMMLTKFFNFHFSPDNNLMKDDARGKIKQELFFHRCR